MFPKVQILEKVKKLHFIIRDEDKMELWEGQKYLSPSQEKAWQHLLNPSVTPNLTTVELSVLQVNTLVV